MYILQVPQSKVDQGRTILFKLLLVSFHLLDPDSAKGIYEFKFFCSCLPFCHSVC